MAYTYPPSEPIAIIGSGCRFPGKTTSPSKLWDLLTNPTDLSKKTPLDRFDVDGFYNTDGEHHGTTNATSSYWLEEDHRMFDAAFFNITPKEAEAIDPQARLLLETTYEAMESAGLTIAGCSGKNISVFVGTMTADYDGLTQRDEQYASQYCATGTSRALISNRISYFFNWHGPSFTLDTACSSSLVAVHQAVVSLRNGECTAACAAGANVMLGPENFIAEAKLHMLSPTGKSKMWDIDADGYARGEGIAVVMLKTLSRALADGDKIEGIIRETGVNSDGRTQGITMPSPEAQRDLIVETYRKSGLDPKNPEERCQYFEAHGTGTQAGDPREAQAISEAFFPLEKSPAHDGETDLQKLLVGSIKTLIGHTEGAAGIAGLLKANLAMKNRTVPPNLHLQTLNPKVAPFYSNLKVPILLTPWPLNPTGQPLRSSVNSFGFGGTNAHAIIESYEPWIHNRGRLSQTMPQAGKNMPNRSASSTFPIPLLFSAYTQTALASTVENFVTYLKSNESVDLHNLAYTLSSRRSVFPYKVSFTGLDQEHLIQKMDKQLCSRVEMGKRSNSGGSDSRILGIFTGQGAQWAAMGKALQQSSNVYSATIQKLDAVLRTCPNPPNWSLQKELIAPASESRLDEAALSQPLCTAIQIALVDLLQHSGVTFSAVVGHSSGEISAAYAAGILTARDAILIAYYRGYHAKLATGPNGMKGAMMAAGLDIEEAMDLCEDPKFLGRVYIAASNAPASVTLSGNIDAIHEVQATLEERKKFVRVLKVDTAYHSHHMDPCAAPYLRSIKACRIQPQKPIVSCTWVSSVYGTVGSPTIEELSGVYWRDNMVQPVLFTEALERLLREDGAFDAALEIGPHPALKGPGTQTVKAVFGKSMPYYGVLDRKENDLVAFGDALGFLWTHLGPSAANLDSYMANFENVDYGPPQIIANLPSYPWDHSQLHYRESRLSRQYLRRRDFPNELLGTRTSDDSDFELRWRNILKPNESIWLKDHRFQGQIIVPAAAYCIMALDAGRALSVDQPIKTIEIRNLSIHSGITMDETSQGVEILFSLTRSVNSHIRPGIGDDTIEANFCISSTSVDKIQPMKKSVSGQLLVIIGKQQPAALPVIVPHNQDLNPVDLDEFYSQMQSLGLKYTGAFRALGSIDRKMDFATATLERRHPLDTSNLLVSPISLDVCFQPAFAAFASPGDGSLWTSFLPKSIRCLRFNLALCDLQATQQEQPTLHVEASITNFNPTTSIEQANFSGDIEVFNSKGEMEIQIEGLSVVSFAASSAVDDRQLYLHTVWAADPLAGLSMLESDDTEVDSHLNETFGKVIDFYTNGRDSLSSKQSSRDSIEQFVRQSIYHSALEFIKTCSQTLPPIVISSLLPGIKDECSAFHHFAQRIGRVLKCIAHRYPRIKILEVGDGTDGQGILTSCALNFLGNSFSSYTYANSDEAGFDRLPGVLRDKSRKISFKRLELTKDVTEQGFASHSFDVAIIPSQLLSAYDSEASLKNANQLMKPGGYLLVLNSSGELLRQKILRCVLPSTGCQSSGTEIKVAPNALSTSDTSNASDLPFPASEKAVGDWNRTLKAVGFSDAIHHYTQGGQGPKFSLIVSQSVDEVIDSIQNPLQSLPLPSISGTILIIGGKTFETKRISNTLVEVLTNSGAAVIATDSFESLDPNVLGVMKAAVILSDLDESIIATMDENKLAKLQAMFSPNRFVLWITKGSREDDPYHNAAVGIGRCIKAETPQLTLQFLDLDSFHEAANNVLKAFVRLAIADSTDLSTRLWTIEPELAIEKGITFIPRLFPIDDMNNRLNMTRRVISKDVDTSKSVVELTIRDSLNSTVDYFLKQVCKANRIHTPKGHVTIQVQYSSISAIRMVSGNYLYVCIGFVDDKKYVALSASNASFITVPISNVSAISDEIEDDELLLELVVYFFIAEAIARDCCFGSVILFEPSESLAVYLSNKTLLCLTNDPKKTTPDSRWHTVHPHATDRALKSIIPQDAALFVDCNSGSADMTSLREHLPSSCVFRSREYYVQARSAWNPGTITEQLDATLEGVVSFATHTLSMDNITHGPTKVLSIEEALGWSSKTDSFSIINWSSKRLVPELQQAFDPATMFSSTKTYLLVGLTGELGQSLCKFMVLSGVRYIVVASRNPPKNPKWRAELEGMGATIRIESMNVTCLDDVIRLRNKIIQTMPPVGGVANGAMVLSDGTFANMSLESLQKVLGPKVQGSRNLHEAFLHDELQFFIMFSSLTAVAGNRGQGNYAAANMYMAGLAAKRRKLGLVASVLNIGMLMGIGYVNRQQGEVYNNMRKQGYLPISERDIHHMFIEAVSAGHVDSPHGSELTTGLQRYSITDKTPYHWHFNPKFSHHTLESDVNPSSSSINNNTTAQSVKQQLQDAKTTEGVLEVLATCFAAQLEVMLHLPPSTVNKEAPIIELGVDSLVAVEIRSWFLREVNKDMPVLRILGGASLFELCNDIAADVAADISANRSHTEPSGGMATIDAGELDKSPTTLDALVDAKLDATKFYEQIEDMSYNQTRIYFPSLLLEDKTAYNCTTSYTLRGPLDVSVFEKALHQIVQRHEIFRTSFYTDPSNGEPMQIISTSSPFKLTKVSFANQEEDIRQETSKIATHIYDLEAGDVFIATLLQHDVNLHTIVFGYHHIIMDGVSWQIFLQDLDKLYSSPVELPAPIQFTSFSKEQRTSVETRIGLQKREYWKSEFKDPPGPLPPLPFAKVTARKPLARYEIKDFFVRLDNTLVTSIKKSSIGAKSTTFHFYLSVLQVFFHRSLDVNNLCIGITDANRTNVSFLRTVGFLLDSLPLRFQIRNEESFLDRLQNTRDKTYSALSNSGIPLDTILQDLKIASSSDTLPLFQVLVNYRMGALGQKTVGDVKLDYLAYEDAKHPFDFILTIDEDEGAAGLSLSMQEYMYDQLGGDLFLETYVHLLEAFANNTALGINECEFFDPKQKISAITLGTGPTSCLEWPEETLSTRIDTMLLHYPNDVAIKEHFGVSMTYEQMSERSNAIATQLLAMGVEKGARIGLFCEPCADAVCALLAIMRLGAIYVPLDVRNSIERLGVIVAESETILIIHHSSTRNRIDGLTSSNFQALDLSVLGTTGGRTIPNQSHGSDPAFIIFTSGSTGKPKGIILTHTNFLKHVMAATQTMALGKERVLQQSAFGYDASLAQMFYALANGGSIVISSNKIEMTVLAELIREENITLTLCSPSEYTVLMQYDKANLVNCDAWRIAMCGGEAFPRHLKAGFRNLHLPGLKVFNAYGPTEIAVASNIGEVDYRNNLNEEAKIPIGRAMPNYATYILDETAQPVPPGYVGEICVGGPAVSTGYVTSEALTHSKFIPDQLSQPQIHNCTSGWNTIYRTSDKGRMLADGSIVYLGRVDGDSQIKLRGIRIELEDIASSMIKSSGGALANVAVSVRGSESQNQYLVAHVVFASDNKPEDPAQYLQKLILDLPLPVYMQPAIAIPLDHFPATASGKVDFRALQELSLAVIASSDTDSNELDEFENGVKQIWQEALSNLGLRVSKSSNFFSLGGNSLLLLKVQAEVAKRFKVTISLPSLFKAITLETLALAIRDRVGFEGSDASSGNGTSSGMISMSPASESSFELVDDFEEKKVNWEAETTPINLPSSILTKSHTKPLSVVLTGATGFLGRAILQELEQRNDILHIHCIAVRQKNVVNNSDKVSYQYGDLSLPLFGMFEAEARLIFEDADAIIHNGADVSFMKTFDSLRLPNLASTKELVNQTVHRGTPFHFVSTAGVVQLSGQDEFDEESVAAFTPPDDGTNGYVASKWASERYLEKVNNKLGLPVWIHRPSNITGDGAPPMDIMQNVMKYSRILRAVPDLTGWTGFLDFVNVQTVAKSIADHVILHKRSRLQGVEYVHHCGDSVVPLTDIKEFFTKTTGYEFRMLPMREWVKNAQKNGMHELVGGYLNTIGVAGDLPQMPRLKAKRLVPS